MSRAGARICTPADFAEGVTIGRFPVFVLHLVLQQEEPENNFISSGKIKCRDKTTNYSFLTIIILMREAGYDRGL